MSEGKAQRRFLVSHQWNLRREDPSCSLFPSFLHSHRSAKYRSQESTWGWGRPQKSGKGRWKEKERLSLFGKYPTSRFVCNSCDLKAMQCGISRGCFCKHSLPNTANSSFPHFSGPSSGWEPKQCRAPVLHSWLSRFWVPHLPQSSWSAGKWKKSSVHSVRSLLSLPQQI